VDWRVVRLEEGEILLRAWEPGDQELLGTSMRDPVIGRYLGRRLDVAEGEPLPDDPDAPVFAIVEGGAVVGVVWFGRGIRPFEVGYYLHPDAWGRGLATRSLRLVSEWMLVDRGEERIVLITHPENAASQAVARRAGYREAGEIDPYALFKDGTTRAVRFERTRVTSPAGSDIL
jgi:RimJ/RimL family protein N-acetyltransferase